MYNDENLFHVLGAKLGNYAGIILSFLVLIVFALLIIFVPISYVYNIYQFAQCDFKEPFRAEAIRGIGVVAFPVGVVVGFMDLGQ